VQRDPGPIWFLSASLLAGGLLAAALDLAVGFLPRPSGLAGGIPLAATVTLGLLIFLALGAALALALLGGGWGRGAQGRAAGAGFLALPGAVLGFALGQMLPFPGGDAAALVCSGGLAAVSGSLGWLLGAPSRRSRFRLLVTLAPWVAGATLVVAWLVAYRLKAGVAVPAAATGILAPVGAVLVAGIAASRSHRIGPWVAGGGAAGIAIGVAALWWSVAAASVAPPAASPPGSAPSVVLITIDTLRADAISFEDPERRNPTLSDLAKDSLHFENAVSVSSWTKPSVATLLTGVAPDVHGAVGVQDRLPDALDSLAERFRAAGYRTAAVGRNVNLTEQLNFDQGFDYFRFFPEGRLGGSISARLLVRTFRQRFRYWADTPFLTDLAVAWVRQNASAPFFLWLHYFDPHAPYEPPASLVRDAVPEHVASEEHRRARALYQAEVTWVDRHLGRLVEELRAQEIYEEALLVVTSDHGEEFGDHGGEGHGATLYREQLHVPLLVKLPGSARTGRVRRPVSTLAVAETIAQGAGLPPSDQGVSSLLAAPGEAPESLFSAHNVYGDSLESVRMGSFKLIRPREGRGGEELYDLSRDPREESPIDSLAVLEEARRLLDDARDEWRSRRERLGTSAPDRIELDRETEEHLRALGYLEGEEE